MALDITHTETDIELLTGQNVSLYLFILASC